MKAYQERLKDYWDQYSILTSQKEEGRKEGRKEGKKEGIKEGKKEGKMEATLLIAKMMKAHGESIEKIAAYTGLTEEEIEKLL